MDKKEEKIKYSIIEISELIEEMKMLLDKILRLMK
tara:strand:+ start:280 stop:384 length:105 start_codon:yes stop_codon:yes gene_type:complete